MTKDQKSAINILYESGEYSYNRLWEFCDRNGISVKDAIHYIAETFRPEGCVGCHRVGPYLGNPDCGKCSRNFKDYYQQEESV